MKIILIVMMFFVISALFIVSNNNLAMYKQENIVSFVDMYTKWINNLFSNTEKLTGQAIKLDWLPQEFYDVKIKTE